MNILIVIVLSLLAFGLTTFLGFAGTMESGDEKKKALFVDPGSFGDSTLYSSCHQDGNGLEQAE